MSPKKIVLPLDLYVRVSDVRGRSGDTYISPDVQEERCRALAASRGYEVGVVFLDEDKSGGKMDRPGLNQAIARIEEGVSAGIIVAKLDRFARTLIGGLQTLEKINGLGGAVIVADGEFDTSTATGELVLNMMLSLAQFELRRIRENWTAAQTRAVDRGVHISSRVPPGYVLPRGDDGAALPLEPHPTYGPMIREAFAMAAHGEKYARVADYLNAEGVASGDSSTHWQSNRIKRLLANRVYLGEARYGSIVKADAHEPLTTPETFLLAQRGESGVALSQSEYLLTGLCRCAECLYSMKPNKARGHTTAFYRCQVNTATGKCSHPSSISMSKLEEYVLDQFLSRVPDAVGEPIEDDSAEAVEAALAAESKYKAELVNLDLRDTIGEADHDVIVKARYDAWNEALAAIPAPSRTAGAGSLDIPRLVADLQKADDVTGLRELMASSIQAVLISPAASRSNKAPLSDRVRIVWSDEPALVLPKRGQRFKDAEAA